MTSAVDPNATIDSAVANQHAAEARRRPLSFWTKSAYGAGAMVDGLISTATNLFLFFYLTAVCGLSGSLTGLSLFVALVADAVIDPLVGSLSDNAQSRWGRRHPFLIWSAPPLALAFGLLFSLPAGLTGVAAFCYVTLFSIALRAALSGFNVPYFALGAELTDDYVERSSLVSFRLFLGSVGSVICMGMGPLIFFRGTAGMLQRGAYAPFAWTVAILAAAAATVCVATTLSLRHRLHQTPPHATRPIQQFVTGIVELFRNPTFVFLFVCEVLYFVALGVNSTLTFHVYIFFWHIPQGFNQTIIIAGVFGTPLGVWLNDYTSKRFEKRTVVVAGILISCVCQALFPLLKFAGVMPGPGPVLYGLMIANSVLVGAVITTETIAFYSMIADAADEHEHRFQTRREGLYFAGLSFAIKSSSGLGSLVAGLALDAIHFPTGLVAKGGAPPVIPAQTLTQLGLLYGPGIAAISALSALALFGYRLDRRAHATILGELDARREALAAGRA
jgi:GPH family glycoside/pentoside/hexuronide:cation symporter